MAEGVSSAYEGGFTSLHIYLDEAHKDMGDCLDKLVSNWFSGVREDISVVETYALNHAAFHLTSSKQYIKASFHFNSVERLFVKLKVGSNNDLVQTIKRDFTGLVSVYSSDPALNELFLIFRASISSGCFERDPRTLGIQVMCRTEDPDLLGQAEGFLRSCSAPWWKPLRAEGYRNDVVYTLQADGDGVSSVCYSSDGNTALSGSYDKTVIWWDLKKGTKKKVCVYV